MTLHEHVTTARARLGIAGITEAEASRDAELLARLVLRWDRATFVVHRHDAAPEAFATAYEALVARREAREPIARIRGSQEFWGLDFTVTPDTLVPRPETELVIELLLDQLPAPAGDDATRPPTIVDVGTGTGCLAVAAARELPMARIVATDVSHAALAVARRNAARHGLAGQIAFIQADLLEGLTQPIDVIISNPPYVPTAVVAALAPEVSGHEPTTAIAGGSDGLIVIRRLIRQAAACLRPGGRLLFEFGIGQLGDIRAAVADARSLELVRVAADLQGIPRVVVIERHAAPGDTEDQ